MSRLLRTISVLSFLVLIFLGCDTKDNVKPRNDNFFIKYYGGPESGSQFGEDIIETSDGGLLLAATSVNSETDLESMILVKTDVSGNVEWDFSSNFLDPTINCKASSIVELGNSGGFVLGGTIGEGSSRNALLIKVDIDGNFQDSTVIKTEYPNEYHEMSKLTFTHNHLIVSGQTSVPVGGKGGRNGYIVVVNQDFSFPSTPGLSIPAAYFGLEGDEYVVGAYEVIDTVGFGAAGTRIVAFGASPAEAADVPDTGYDYFAIQFNRSLTIINNIGPTKFKVAGNQIPYAVNRFNDKFYVVGTTDLGNNMFFKEWINNTWTPNPGDIGNSTNIEGTGVAVRSNNYVVVGNHVFTEGIHEEILLSKVVNNNISTPWPKYFGNSSSSYNASAVTILQDGSIVTIGTADLEPIKKIVVIKTGPNGEMSFDE